MMKGRGAGLEGRGEKEGEVRGGGSLIRRPVLSTGADFDDIV